VRSGRITWRYQLSPAWAVLVPGRRLQDCRAASVSRGAALAKSRRSGTLYRAAMASLCRITSSSLAADSSVKARISRSGGVCVPPVKRSVKRGDAVQVPVQASARVSQLARRSPATAVRKSAVVNADFTRHFVSHYRLGIGLVTGCAR
jgi:hypothetical protein